MVSIIAIFTGVLYSVMNTFNAELNVHFGMILSTTIVHFAGGLCLWPLLFTRWGKRKRPAKWFLYGGGLSGVITVVAYNVGIGVLGATASMAISLLSQIVVSAILDAKGIIGAKPLPLNKNKLIGMALIAIGCAIMILGFMENNRGSVLLAAVIMIVAGLSIVFTRLSNAMLAAVSGIGHSTIMNHTTGFFACLILFILFGFPGAESLQTVSIPWGYYLGGPLGAVSIFVLNTITKKAAQVRITLILFIGQTLSSILIDAWVLNKFSILILPGIALVTLGLIVNDLGDRNATKEKA